MHYPHIKLGHLAKEGSESCKHHASVMQSINVHSSRDRHFLLTWMEWLGKYMARPFLEHHACVVQVMRVLSGLPAYKSILSTYTALPQCLLLARVMDYAGMICFMLSYRSHVPCHCFHTNPILRQSLNDSHQSYMSIVVVYMSACLLWCEDNVSMMHMSPSHIFFDMFKICHCSCKIPIKHTMWLVDLKCHSLIPHTSLLDFSCMDNACMIYSL